MNKADEMNKAEEEEEILSLQTQEQWQRRRRELADWTQRDKQTIKPKQTVRLGEFLVDAELRPAIAGLWQAGVSTEFSCAGVSVLDEPEDHSLYAYITLIDSGRSQQFVQYAMQQMKHRLLVVHEPSRCRYDLSSFFIGHNRSYCLLMARCAEQFGQMD